MDTRVIKEELNRILIKTNFEERGHVKQYVVTREDLIRTCIKVIKLIEKINNEG